MSLADDLLLAVMPTVKTRLPEWRLPLEDAMREFAIDVQALRAAAFLAQIAHESGELRHIRELWGPTAQQRKYEPPSDLATRLGNTQPGDGFRFRGRGLIQITGRANYAACSQALLGAESSLLLRPERLEDPRLACRSAAWFWESRGLNTLADQGPEAFEAITRRINGGLTGLAERKRYYQRALEVLGVAAHGGPSEAFSAEGGK